VQRFAGIAVLVVGIVLIVLGVNASQSFGSDVSRFFSGAVTNKSIYFLAGGALAVLAGASMAFSGRRRTA